MMVRSPDIDHPVETALELFHVVGDIRCEIGCLTVVANHDAILLVAECRGTEPACAVFLVDVAGLGQGIDGAFDGTGVDKRAFRIPVLVGHAEEFEIVPDIVEDGVEAKVEDMPVARLLEQEFRTANQRIDMFLLVTTLGLVRRHVLEHLAGGMPVDIAELAMQGRGDIEHIVALVAVGRERDLLTSEFQVAQPDRRGQDIHLAAGVVDIIFAVHVEACSLQQVGHGCTVGRAAPVAHVQGTGRVCGDKFHLDTFALADGRASETVFLFENLRHDLVTGCCGDKEVDKPGTCNLDLLDGGVCGQRGDDLFCECARAGLRGLAQHHGDIGREIAMAGVTGALDHGLTQSRCRQDLLSGQGFEGGRDQLLDVRFHVHFDQKIPAGKDSGKPVGRRGAIETWPARCCFLEERGERKESQGSQSFSLGVSGLSGLPAGNARLSTRQS